MVGSDAVVSNSKVEEGRLCEPTRSAIAARPRKAQQARQRCMAWSGTGEEEAPAEKGETSSQRRCAPISYFAPARAAPLLGLRKKLRPMPGEGSSAADANRGCVTMTQRDAEVPRRPRPPSLREDQTPLVALQPPCALRAAALL